MMSRWKAALFSGSAIVAINAGALAQNPPQPPAGPAPAPTVGQAPLYDPQQLPAQRGQVQQFTLTPRGDIDGLILTDGTEVKTPPHLSTEIAYSVKPGDAVTIHGLRAAALAGRADRSDGCRQRTTGPWTPWRTTRGRAVAKRSRGRTGSADPRAHRSAGARSHEPAWAARRRERGVARRRHRAALAAARGLSLRGPASAGRGSGRGRHRIRDGDRQGVRGAANRRVP